MNTIMKKSEISLDMHSERKLGVSVIVGGFGAESHCESKGITADIHSEDTWIKEVILIPLIVFFFN